MGFLPLQRKVNHGLDSPALTFFKGFKIWNQINPSKRKKTKNKKKQPPPNLEV